MYQLLLLRMRWQKELVRNLLQDKLIKIRPIIFSFQKQYILSNFVSICSEIRHMEQFVWMEVHQLITGIRDLVQELTIGWFTLRFVLLSHPVQPFLYQLKKQCHNKSLNRFPTGKKEKEKKKKKKEMGINTEAIFLMPNSNNKYYSSALMKRIRKS